MLKNIFYLTMFMAVVLLLLAKPMVPRTLASPSAVTFTVDSTLDLIDDNTADGVCTPGSCSLRAAIMQANHLSGPGMTTIIVPAGTYTLTRPKSGANGEDNGDLNLTAPLNPDQSIVINGAGAASTIIDANQIDGVMSIAANRTASISGLTIRHGYRLSDVGGGILNKGKLTITDCAIEGNRTDYDGGGIASGGPENPATLDVVRCTIRSNVASGFGGGLGMAGPTTIRDSTIYNNAANFGGGIFNVYRLYVVNSTISQNTADTDGGGIFNYFMLAEDATVALYNTSVIGNDADHDHDQTGGIGGGVYNYAGFGSRFIVVNSLIAGNTIMNTPIYDDCNGTLEVYGWNLFGEVTGCTFSGNGTASRGFISLNTIGPLQDNGGPTWTQALLAGSEAIDTTLDVLGCVDETGAQLTTDQRGASRPVGARCDVGAFEYRPLRYLYLPLVLR